MQLVLALSDVCACVNPDSCRRESHYGENDGDGDVHGMKRHREQSVTP